MTTHDRPEGRARRIALVTSRYWPSFGGIQSHVQALAEHLVGAGHEVTVLTHDLDGDDPEHDVLNGVRVRRFLPLVPSEHLLLAPALGAHLASSRSSYDLVHAHGYHDTPAALVMRSWEGPYVFTPHFHGSSASRLRSALHVPYRRVGRRIVHHARRVVCVTPSEREAFLRWFPTAVDKTDVISNGVDVDRLRAAAPRDPEPCGRRLLVTAGRLEAYKRVDRVVDAMAHLGDRFVLEVCGDGPERAALEQRAARAGLGHAVRFRGRVSDADLASTISSAAALVSMSEHEAQGIVLLEAAAAGTRSVASHIPAHADVAATTGATHLVPADAEPHHLAGTIADAAGRPRATAAVASWPDVAARTARLYEDVLRTHPAGSAPRVGGGARPPA
ncbi:MAG: glycosyltransferase family 4 protein [Acidimicrobiales bacterium]